MTEDFYERLLDVSTTILERSRHKSGVKFCVSWSPPNTAVLAIVYDGKASAEHKLHHLYGAYNDAEFLFKAEKFYAMLKDRVEGTSLEEDLRELRELIDQLAKEN